MRSPNSLSNRLIVACGKAIGLTLTYSNNHGGWSKGRPYSKTDIEFNPLLSNSDALEVAQKLGIDIPFSRDRMTVSKARLFVTLKASQLRPKA